MKSTLIAPSSRALAAIALAEAPLKGIILAGQSNMEGAGKIEGDPNHNGGKGSLSYLVENSKDYTHLKDKNGKWVERDDVSI